MKGIGEMEISKENGKMEIDYVFLGKRLTEEMKLRNITSEALSFRTGIQKRTIDEIMKGKKSFVILDTICAITSVIGCDLEDLLSERSERYEEIIKESRRDIFKKGVLIERETPRIVNAIELALRYALLILEQLK